ncbi:MAG: phage holin family protein [Planctomycetaceae bacterium]|nr:phage holin family protein [Planctomycetaceae bacterium]
MNGNRATTAESPAPARSMGRSVRQLGSDVITLMELQAELLQVDLREWLQSFIRPLAALLGAAIILLATAPVALVSVGFLLAAKTELPLWGAMMTATLIGLLLAAASAGVGVWLVKRDRRVLQRFRTELRKNVQWLKETLRSAPAGNLD